MATTMTLERANRLMGDVRDEGVKYIQFVYDIPQRPRGDEEAPFPNPSSRLRWFAFRVNLSCWTLPANRFVLLEAVIKRMEEYNEAQTNPRLRIHYELFPYHNMGEELVKESCLKAMEKEAAHIHGSLILALDRATRAFDRALYEGKDEKGDVSQRIREEATIKKEKHMSLALKRAQLALDAALQAAEAFDKSEDVGELLKVLAATIESQEESYKALVQDARDTMFGYLV